MVGAVQHAADRRHARRSAPDRADEAEGEQAAVVVLANLHDLIADEQSTLSFNASRTVRLITSVQPNGTRKLSSHPMRSPPATRVQGADLQRARRFLDGPASRRLASGVSGRHENPRVSGKGYP